MSNVFQSPKGRLQTKLKLIVRRIRSMFQSPKGRLQTCQSGGEVNCRKRSFNPQREGYKQFVKPKPRKLDMSVSIPKGKATNDRAGYKPPEKNVLFQSPKGRLQTAKQFYKEYNLKRFQSPKGRLQTG